MARRPRLVVVGLQRRFVLRRLQQHGPARRPLDRLHARDLARNETWHKMKEKLKRKEKISKRFRIIDHRHQARSFIPFIIKKKKKFVPSDLVCSSDVFHRRVKRDRSK